MKTFTLEITKARTVRVQAESAQQALQLAAEDLRDDPEGLWEQTPVELACVDCDPPEQVAIQP